MDARAFITLYTWTHARSSCTPMQCLCGGVCAPTVPCDGIVRCAWQAARRAAAGETVDPSSFGGLYPPRDETQQWLHKAIADFAAADAADAPPTLALPPSLSGFHKASAHLYATLLGCSETSGEQGGITLKRKRQSANGGGGGGGGEARRDFGGDEDLDFETRLTLRLQKKESELQQQVRIAPCLNAPSSSHIHLHAPSSSPAASRSGDIGRSVCRAG